MLEVMLTANSFHIITFFNYWNSFGNRNILTTLKIYTKFCGKRQINGWIAFKNYCRKYCDYDF